MEGNNHESKPLCRKIIVLTFDLEENLSILEFNKLIDSFITRIELKEYLFADKFMIIKSLKEKRLAAKSSQVFINEHFKLMKFTEISPKEYESAKGNVLDILNLIMRVRLNGINWKLIKSNVITEEELEKIQEEEKDRRKLKIDNSRLIHKYNNVKNVMTLIQNGDIPMNNLHDEREKLIKFRKEQKFAELDNKPLLDGTITWFNQLYKMGPDGVLIPDLSVKPVPVSFTGIIDPENTTKKKHLFLYSKQPNWGKSHMIHEEIILKFRAQYISDLNNADALYSNVQIFVVEEYGGGTRKFDFEIFKSMLGGIGEAVALNRKSYGESFEIPKMAQFIFISNKSIYEIYAERKGGSLYISADMIRQIESRLNIVCLGGDVNHDRLMCSDPTNLSVEESIIKISAMAHSKFNENKELNVVDDTKSLVKRIMDIYQSIQLCDCALNNGLTFSLFEKLLESCITLSPRLKKFTWGDYIQAMNNTHRFSLHTTPVTVDLDDYITTAGKKILYERIETMISREYIPPDSLYLYDKVGEFFTTLARLRLKSRKIGSKDFRDLFHKINTDEHFYFSLRYAREVIHPQIMDEYRQKLKEELSMENDMMKILDNDILVENAKKRKLEEEINNVCDESNKIRKGCNDLKY